MDFSGRVDITNFATKQKKLSGGVCNKFLFEMNGKKYVFKQNFYRNKNTDIMFEMEGYPNNVNELCSDVVEVFSYKFLTKLGCDFAIPYYLASFQGKNGCICPYFGSSTRKFDFVSILQNLYWDQKTPRKKFGMYQFIDFEDDYETDFDGQYLLSVDQVLEKTEEFCKKYGFEFDLESNKQKLEIITALDFFMANNDRSWCNVVFLKSKKCGKTVLELAPLFDNGESFGMADFARTKKSKKHNYYLKLGISENGRNFNFEDNKFFKNQRLIASDILTVAKTNKKLQEIICNYQNLDFNKLLKEFEKENNLKLPKNQRTEMQKAFEMQQTVFNLTKKQLDKRIQKSKTKSNQNSNFIH